MLTNASTIIQVVSGLLALVSVAGGIYTAMRSSKDKRERETDRGRVEAERQKLGAEQDKIKNEAAEIALRSLRTELDAAYKDIDRRREIMKTQDERIDEQDKIIRDQNRRIGTLEDTLHEERKRMDRLEHWIRDYKHRFDELGIKSYVDQPIEEWPDPPALEP